MYKSALADPMSGLETSRHPVVLPSVSEIRASIASHGWAYFSGGYNSVIELAYFMGEIGNLLGSPVAPRGRALIQSLVPTPLTESRPASMSAMYGLGQQPWHVDLAHWPIPARFIVLGCESTGDCCVPTEITDCSELLLNPGDNRAAHCQPYLIRNGRDSFYSTMLDKRRPFIRLDPGCMVPRSEAAQALQARIQSLRPDSTVTIEWAVGDVLVLDNWRVAHRRSDATNTMDRRLLRVSVMERT
jgi:alpha-ketoglutarate-dependent taurine dioxygenase